MDTNVVSGSIQAIGNVVGSVLAALITVTYMWWRSGSETAPASKDLISADDTNTLNIERSSSPPRMHFVVAGLLLQPLIWEIHLLLLRYGFGFVFISDATEREMAKNIGLAVCFATMMLSGWVGCEASGLRAIWMFVSLLAPIGLVNIYLFCPQAGDDFIPVPVWGFTEYVAGRVDETVYHGFAGLYYLLITFVVLRFANVNACAKPAH